MRYTDEILGGEYPPLEIDNPIRIEYGNGEEETKILGTEGLKKVYTQGEYILKFSNIKNFKIDPDYYDTQNAEFELIQWGKVEENNERNDIQIVKLSKIHEPEPDKVPIAYISPKFQEIPENLFINKKESKVMSRFFYANELTSIPENLFKHNIKAEDFFYTFYECQNITTIPENLFKYNKNAKKFWLTFLGMKSLTNIPENLFEHNINAEEMYSTFAENNIINIPENLFKNNQKIADFIGVCSKCKNITSTPENLFKYNMNAKNFSSTFYESNNITSIPENLFKYNVKAESFVYTFGYLNKLTNIPENLFKYNTKVDKIRGVFGECEKITSIPENLFENFEKNIDWGESVFSRCKGLLHIPEKIINKIKAATYNRDAFEGCINADNYNLLPAIMKGY